MGGRIFTLLIASLLSSCSVAMAVKRSGLDVNDLDYVCSREQLIRLGAEPIGCDHNEEGQVVETYKIHEELGSTVRAFLHGVLDLSTFFVWELVGVPLENSLIEKKFYSFRVTFDEEDRIQKIDVL